MLSRPSGWERKIEMALPRPLPLSLDISLSFSPAPSLPLSLSLSLSLTISPSPSPAPSLFLSLYGRGGPGCSRGRLGGGGRQRERESERCIWRSPHVEHDPFIKSRLTFRNSRWGCFGRQNSSNLDEDGEDLDALEAVGVGEEDRDVVPHGGPRPFHQKPTCITQLTLGPSLVQI